MYKKFLICALALAMTAGVATAQTIVAEGGTMPGPAVAAPDSSTVTRSSREVNPDGSVTNSKETTHRDGSGVLEDRAITTTTAPPAPVISTTTSRTTVSE